MIVCGNFLFWFAGSAKWKYYFRILEKWESAAALEHYDVGLKSQCNYFQKALSKQMYGANICTECISRVKVAQKKNTKNNIHLNVAHRRFNPEKHGHSTLSNLAVEKRWTVGTVCFLINVKQRHLARITIVVSFKRNPSREILITIRSLPVARPPPFSCPCHQLYSNRCFSNSLYNAISFFFLYFSSVLKLLHLIFSFFLSFAITALVILL